MFLSMQLLISIAFLLVGLAIPTNGFFMMSLAIFWVAAFASASNDIATDGFYLLVLPEDKQSFFIGIRSTFYRLSMLAGNGLVVLFAGYLEHKYGDNTKAWSYTMIFVGLLMTFITAYNFIFTPKNEINAVESKKETPHQNFGTIFISFFKKKPKTPPPAETPAAVEAPAPSPAAATIAPAPAPAPVTAAAVAAQVPTPPAPAPTPVPAPARRCLR